MTAARAAIVLAAALAAACAPVGRSPERHPSLAKAYQGHFPVGVAVEPRHLESREGRFVAWHFNSLVAENAMKPRALQPQEGRFEFAGADRIVEFARQHCMKVRCHTLVWHQQNPDWLTAGSFTRDELVSKSSCARFRRISSRLRPRDKCSA